MTCQNIASQEHVASFSIASSCLTLPCLSLICVNDIEFLSSFSYLLMCSLIIPISYCTKEAGSSVMFRHFQTLPPLFSFLQVTITRGLAFKFCIKHQHQKSFESCSPPAPLALPASNSMQYLPYEKMPRIYAAYKLNRIVAAVASEQQL